ncbi:palmitoyltransferase ZDHHC12 isoform X4 [Trichechus manatus latirostris]|uniref:Palmitoyltransferase n=1 Tax=Trichechus manatus latirostris TaxID=127582 RepID=A0A2Y9R472_TRIMA|nr:palmitoyltransferase ZDHHC12 isoform X4 [Trichechus manatus latirostris]
MAPWAFISPGVVVRTGHTVLTWGITLVLFLHDTELRQWEEQGELLLPLTFLLLVLGSLLLYLAVSLMDPGYMNVQPQPQEELKEEQMAMVPQATPLRRCRYCLVLQPLRARHCHECHRCVRRYDHHCPWMENCVGERNHPLFVAYLALQLVVLLWALYLACPGGCGCGPVASYLPHSCCCLSSHQWPACSWPRISTWWPATPPRGSSSPHTALPTSANAPATPSTAA